MMGEGGGGGEVEGGGVGGAGEVDVVAPAEDEERRVDPVDGDDGEHGEGDGARDGAAGLALRRGEERRGERGRER